MSYLNPLRLHFSGRFLTAPSTVNNDPTHYNNSTFKPEYQERGAGATRGWWNPGGDAYWRFIGCRVTGAFGADGGPAGAGDPVRQCLVADSDRKTAAKLADLDPEQQLVSEIWGLEVRLTTPGGDTLMRGRYDVAAFMDIWDRWPGTGGDGLAGAMYQSVITDLEWGPVDESPFLSALRDASAESGMLSIKFNVDMYDMNYKSPTFTQGRIAGTIGPAAAGEPHHLVLGRQFMPYAAPGGNFFAPAGAINACVGVVDEARGKVLLDLGNALPLVSPDAQPPSPPGTFQDLGALSLACLRPTDDGVESIPLGDIDYLWAGWYEETAGVVEVPAKGALTAEQLEAVAGNPLALLVPGAFGQPSVAVSEPRTGLFARADRYVYRLEAGEEGQAATVFATRFGTPLAKAEIVAVADPSQLQPTPGAPPVATPADGVSFPPSVTTGADGAARLPLTAGDPRNARGYIDGQVYGVRPIPRAVLGDPTYPFSPWHFISVLVWDRFAHDDPPTWHGALQPVFQQYANLYPVMGRFLDLSSYESVCANRNLLLLAFGLDPHDPNYMPAVRDLSGNKRSVILRWLADVGDDGRPLLGAPATAAAKASAAGTADADEAGAALEGIPVTSAVDTRRDVDPALPAPGKATAAARRLVLQR
ncbi:MAG TPA: hypothetical protein VGC13_19725 [Longimicrobium sp.]|jgi:hypothetical protein|uniref:hypothetical protein n=1 Tax=Longimicrobium sp. TaxID=2029185 RepID=UPI002EDAC8E5